MSMNCLELRTIASAAMVTNYKTVNVFICCPHRETQGEHLSKILKMLCSVFCILLKAYLYKVKKKVGSML